jgi:hypothetical protein
MKPYHEPDCVFPLSYVPERPVMRPPRLAAGGDVPVSLPADPDAFRAWAARPSRGRFPPPPGGAAPASSR